MSNMAPCSKEPRQPEEIGYSTKDKEETIQAKPFIKDAQKNDAKSSIHLELGTYGATKRPLAIVLFIMAVLYASTYSLERDPRTANYYMGGQTVTFTISIVYLIAAITWGPKLMENRAPIKLRKTMMVYNIFQVLVCSYIFIEIYLTGWFHNMNLFCQPPDVSNSPAALRMVNGAYIFYLTKLLDFTDTFFFILNKKWANISLLHVVHHSIMILGTWGTTYYVPASHLSFTALLNSFVHVTMYSYYFLAAMGPALQPYLWWKKYLTTMQLVQFVVVFLHSLQVFFNGCTEAPLGLCFMFCICSTIFFVLFSDYYLKEYSKNKKRRSNIKQETQVVIPNGATTNGKLISDELKDSSSYLRERTTMPTA